MKYRDVARKLTSLGCHELARKGGRTQDITLVKPVTLAKPQVITSCQQGFSNKAISSLEERFSAKASEGYKFHSVFQVQQPGCLGIGQGTSTYLAVYVKE